MSMAGKATALLVVLLIVGLAAGYGIGRATAPVKTETVTVPAGPVTTIVTTVTKTVTPAAPTGLQGEVLVGALLPLTGPLSSYGENNRAALELAEREINEWLERVGAAWRLKLVVEDTATDPKTALDKLMAMHGRGIKIFIGPMSSAEVSEIKSYADANKLLVISQSSTSVALSIPGDMILRFCPDDRMQAKAIAKIMWERGIRWVVPIWRGDTWGDGLKELTVEEFEAICKASGESCGVVEGVRYDPEAKEFSVQAAMLASSVKELADKYGKDKVGILAISFEEIASIFTAAMAHPILAEVKWQGSDGTAGVASLVESKELAEFAIKTRFLNTITAPVVSPHLDKVKEYVVEKLGRTPDSYAYIAYDALWVIALALEAVNTYDPVAVMNAIPAVLSRYMGASGWFELNENGDRAFTDYDIWVVRKVGAEYKWDVAGTWRGKTEAVEWREWWPAG